MESLEKSIRHRLIGYLAGKEAYDDFVDWMYGVIWNIEQSSDRGAARLGYSIMLAIAEFDNDVFTLERFQENLRSLIESTAISMENRAPIVPTQPSHTSSSAPEQRREITQHRLVLPPVRHAQPWTQVRRAAALV